mgnify:CR=1 FL=1
MDKFEKFLPVLKGLTQSEDLTNINLLQMSTEIGDIREEELSKMPLHINVITISAVGKLKETAHSSILQHLIRHQTVLDSFMKSIMGIDKVRVHSKSVRKAEQDRIDVSIYDRDICVIIENKVNGTVEQPGQIFRYVQLALEAGYQEEQIRVLYLNSNHHEKPTDFSLTENGENLNRISKTIEDNIIVRDYAHDIYEWIKELSPIIPNSEKYLISALHQYQDYLEEYFFLTDKFQHMRQRIKTVIAENILKGLSDDNDADFSQRIESLSEASENLQQLIDAVNELKGTYSVRKEAAHIQTELAKSDLELIDLADFGYDQQNFGVRISINGKCGYIAYGYGGKEYIGFAFETASLTKTEINYLNRIFKKFGKVNYREEDIWKCWTCWNYIGETSLLNEFSNFVQYVKDLAENDEKCPIKFSEL